MLSFGTPYMGVLASEWDAVVCQKKEGKETHNVNYSGKVTCNIHVVDYHGTYPKTGKKKKRNY